MSDLENSEDEELKYEENKEKRILQYVSKRGSIFINDNTFDHNKEIGENYIYYKPEKIIIWTGEKNEDNVLAGIEIWYRNILNGTTKKCKESCGKKQKDKYSYIIKPTEYLVKFRIWIGDDVIYKINFKTNKGNEFEVGENKGEEIYIDELNGNNIIMSFMGNYNNYLTSLGLLYIEKKKYLQILFAGYFQLKALLRKEEKRNELLEKAKNGEYKKEDLALIKACLLPDNPFNGIIKYCIV
jgi:hypothetical protein